MDPNNTDLVYRCRCAGHDDSLMNGQLYLDAAQEIESLRRDKAHLEETCNAEKERGDEWKRRARLLETLIPNKLRTPEINRWFEEE